MSKLLELPRLGETMEEGEIVAWVKKPGDAVKRGETVAEIQTDKIVAEMPALEDFVLEEILAGEGAVVKVGQALARIRGANEEASSVSATPVAGSVAASSTPIAQVVETKPQPGLIDPISGRVRASPAARRMARELSVNLSNVSGTGPHGRITTEDVRGAATPTMPSNVPVVSALEPSPAESLHRLTRIELAAAKATVKSKTEIPHFYVRTRADVTAFMRGIELEKAKGASISVNDAIVSVVAKALLEHPRLNTVLEGEALRLLPQVHIGVMTATPEGLVTSVVRNANTLSLTQINATVKEIRARAAAGRARAEDLSGATFCISNLGMFGVEEFSAIILPPNVAILAVGAVQDEVVAVDGAIRIAKSMRLTVSADHRALDGVEAATFLQTVRRKLENPLEVFL